MVIDETQVKVLAWYDNEWGYANRLAELTQRVSQLPAKSDPGTTPAPALD